MGEDLNFFVVPKINYIFFQKESNEYSNVDGNSVDNNSFNGKVLIMNVIWLTSTICLFYLLIVVFLVIFCRKKKIGSEVNIESKLTLCFSKVFFNLYPQED